LEYQILVSDDIDVRDVRRDDPGVHECDCGKRFRDGGSDDDYVDVNGALCDVHGLYGVHDLCDAHDLYGARGVRYVHDGCHVRDHDVVVHVQGHKLSQVVQRK